MYRSKPKCLRFLLEAQEQDLDQGPANPPPCSDALRPLPRVADFAKAASPTLCFPPAARAGLFGFFGPATNQAEEKLQKNILKTCWKWHQQGFNARLTRV